MATLTTASVAKLLASIPSAPGGYSGPSTSGYNISTVDVTVVNKGASYKIATDGQVGWEAQNLPATDFLFSQTTSQKNTAGISVSTSNGVGSIPTAPVIMTVIGFDGTHVLLGQTPQGGGVFGTYYLVSDTTQDSSVPADFPALTLTPTGSTYTPPPPAPTCYLAGTRLRTERGETLVEDLQVGDRVAVMDGSAIVMKPVIWIGQRRLEIASYAEPCIALPIRIRRNAVADGVPVRDLLVSPDHAIYVDGVLVPAKLLVNGGSIVQDESFRRVHYYHVELAEHAILFAENLTAESYLDCGNRHSFDNGGNTIVLRPDFALGAKPPAGPHAFCQPMVEDAATVQPVWARLASRSAELGFTAPTPETVTDPALRVRIGERELTAVLAENGRYIFILPPSASDIRLVSRSTIPGEIQPWLSDRRRLGVSVARISLRTETDLIDIALDGPSLDDGWWAPERQNNTAWRWTNGDARVALTSRETTGCLLEIRLACSMDYIVEAGNEQVLKAA